MEKGSKLIFVTFSLLLLFVLIESSFNYDEGDLESEERLRDLYERWRCYHNISRELKEKEKRYVVFKMNLMHVHRVNQLGKTYKLKLNPYSDLTNFEFMQFYAGSKISHFRSLHGPRNVTGFMHGLTDPLPPSVDWRNNGAVNPVKNQANCGGCWAFSTIAAVEGLNKIKTGNLVSLSEQELIDCDTVNRGCEGGLMEKAFEFIKDQRGVTTEINYPYIANNEICEINKLSAPAAIIDGYEMVPENDEGALMKAVANQPVSVGIDATGKDFQFYSQGVYNGDCGSELNHGVAIVGYGSTIDGTNYWIVRNSWGPDWGEEGYIRMQRNLPNLGGGICGIAMEASYPIKNTTPINNNNNNEYNSTNN